MISRRSVIGGAGAGALALSLGTLTHGAAAGPRRDARWERLRRHLRGRLVLPGDAAYPAAKQLSTAEFDAVDPTGIAYCADAADVALCLAFAQDAGLPLAARSGGHSAAGYSTTTGLVIDVSRLASVTVSETSATLGAGTQLVDATHGLAPHGLALSGGFCPTVALGGFLQGGGTGLLTRSVGVSSDTVTAARVVLADGRTVRACRDRHPDLFWALRGGGGGNFGIVTSYEVTPTRIDTLSTANLTWRYDTAVDVLDAWARWIPDAPRALGGSAVVALPDAAAGNVPVVSVLLSSTAGEEVLAAQADRLAAAVGTAPATRQLSTAAYRTAMMNLYGCGDYTVQQCHRAGSAPDAALPRAAFASERSRLFDRPPARAMWERAVARFDAVRVPGQRHLLQVGALGGAVGDLARTDTAYVHRDALFSASFLGVIAASGADDSDRAAAREWTDAGFAVLDPYSNGETYQNFIDPRLENWRRAYYAENYERLVAVKRRYDPHGLFRFAQSIG
ncbi:putative FAD-linked oxidoreductase YvdP [Streptomyces sp. enrichment culture]|uniref:FAD-binding oxidoreductase n=1 Tax=Streptomyces sp. enrichment culture TaxID=1795815 RepID=UPI003F5598D4